MDINKTYCNPTPLPDYPLGRNYLLRENYPHRADYRETADPTVIYEGGKWYLYPSCGMVYWTEDFIHWNHEHMEPYNCGYAPTVVKHEGKFYLLASSSALYVSDSPMGPFESLGNLKSPAGEDVLCDDPMLFSDDDGRLYLYCGCGGAISAAELDAKNPVQLLEDLRVMFPYNTADHVWERMGDWNEDGSYSWTEGSWMLKHDGTYYLIYSAPGTEWVTYAMGAYTSRSPMGPWKYMETSPFIIKREGIVKGTGHGSVVEGPGGTYWVFYTCCMCYGGKFERRIGYDPLGFDADGNIMPVHVSETPSFAPGVIENPHISNSAGLVPLTQHRDCEESSAAPGRDGLYAIDDSMITWWQPADDDSDPTLTVFLSVDNTTRGLDIYSARIIWRDVGLDVKKGYLPGPFGYKIEAEDMDGNWYCVLDKSRNTEDMNIDYNPVKKMRAKTVRLRICSHPEHIKPGVVNFSVFGKWTQEN